MVRLSQAVGGKETQFKSFRTEVMARKETSNHWLPRLTDSRLLGVDLTRWLSTTSGGRSIIHLT